MRPAVKRCVVTRAPTVSLLFSRIERADTQFCDVHQSNAGMTRKAKLTTITVAGSVSLLGWGLVLAYHLGWNSVGTLPVGLVLALIGNVVLVVVNLAALPS